MERRITKIRTSRKPRTRKAATADILADSEQQVKVPRKWQEHYQHLLELRDHFSQEQRTLTEDAKEETPQFSQHMADAGTDSYDRDWALGMLSNEQDARYEIEQALDRIRTGSYGVCELTGKPIPEDRLRAIPWARFSADAEEQLERDGKRRRARLGPRETVPRMQTSGSIGQTQEEP